jgi:enamine deaminase RidA (YjgF/YER057c/UK114 family)
MVMAATSPLTKTALALLLVFPATAGCGSSSANDNSSGDRVDAEARVKELNLKLPAPPAPVANYVGAVRTGKLVYLAGAGAQREDGSYIAGRLGDTFTIEQGYEAARQTALVHLGTLKAEIGDLNRVKRVVKVLGMVNSVPSFTDQPKVINGYSDLIVEVLGDRGRHARSAVGMAVLPFNIPVEVETIVEVE